MMFFMECVAGKNLEKSLKISLPIGNHCLSDENLFILFVILRIIMLRMILKGK